MISPLVSSVDHNLETNQWMGMFLGKIMNLTTKDLRLNKLNGKIYCQIYYILYLLQNITCVVVW